MVDLLALAHERGCEAELADHLTADLDAGRLPELNRLRAHFAPDPAHLPNVVVQLAPLATYERLIGTAETEAPHERGQHHRHRAPQSVAQ